MKLVKRATFVLYVSCIFVMASIICSAQGLLDGFMQPKGKAVLALSYSIEQYDKFYVGEEEMTLPDMLGTVKTESINLYGALGISDALNIVCTTPYIWAKSKPNDAIIEAMSQDDLQDISLLLKWRPVEVGVPDVGMLHLIVAAGLSTPLTAYTANAPVAIGHNFSAYDLHALLNFTTESGLFAAVQLGYYVRNDAEFDVAGEDGGMESTSADVPDVLEFAIKAGFATSLFYADVWIQRQDSRHGPNIGEGPFPIQEISFTRAGLSAYYPLPFMAELGATLGAATILDGQNIGKAWRVSLGVAYGFQVF